MIDDEKRGKLICELRKKKNLTQQELGNLINYTDKNISKWERGISFPSDPNVINKLSEVFGVSVEELMYGELRAKNNEIEIRENFAKQYKNNYNKYRKNIFIILISFLIFVIISLILIYIIFIKNSISVYSLVTKDSNFDEINSTIVITNKINIFNFSKLIDREDIQLISLYYIDESGNKKEIFSGENENYYIEEKRNYEEYFFEKLINNKIYLEVSYKDTNSIDIIEMKAERKYINDNIFPEKVNSSIEQKGESPKTLSEKIVSLGFTNNDGVYEKNINKYTNIKIYDDSMNLIIEVINNNYIEKINSNYSTDSIFYEKIKNGEVVENKESTTKEKKNCETKKCVTFEDYAMYINYIKSKLN